MADRPLLPPFFGIFSFYQAWVMVKVNMKWKRIKEKNDGLRDRRKCKWWKKGGKNKDEITTELFSWRELHV
jgi:hypothetical protein